MAERPEDLNLPNAVVTRIIKDVIPDGVNVSKEARLAISKAASVFILYATSCSNNFAMKSKRKTISAQDVISAMEDMEFEQFCEPLRNCLEAYRLEQKGKRGKKKEKDQNVSGDVNMGDVSVNEEAENTASIGDPVVVSDENSDEGDGVTQQNDGDDFVITVNGDYTNDDDNDDDAGGGDGGDDDDNNSPEETEEVDDAA